MNTPAQALAAIFPESVTAGPYTLRPPTLLHLAAIDRLGISLYEGRIGADAAAAGGFVLSLDSLTLRAFMEGPLADFRAAAADWAEEQPARNLSDLRSAVVKAIDAAFSTAVPGDASDPTPGRPQTSAGPSK
jgi:hypothetical protein